MGNETIFTGEVGRIERVRFVEVLVVLHGKGKWRNKGRGPKRPLCPRSHIGTLEGSCWRCGERIGFWNARVYGNKPHKNAHNRSRKLKKLLGLITNKTVLSKRFMKLKNEILAGATLEDPAFVARILGRPEELAMWIHKKYYQGKEEHGRENPT